MTARMQFILGPDASMGFPGWQRLNVGHGLFLHSHPDLNVEHTSLDSLSATMIGYILDPSRPGRTDSEILVDVVSLVAQGQDLFEIVYPLNGRWVLLVDDGITLRLLTDAAGLRQVRYTHIDHLGQTWCASQAKHIAKALGLQVDAAAMEFMEWSRATDPESWWPGTSSPYRDVKRLLPNHFLDIRTGRAHRFWPTEQRRMRDLDNTAVENIATALSAQILSAAQRFQCAQGLSSGWDSRVLLAASRPIVDRLRYYTLKDRGMTANHPDVRIPGKLAKRLGLPHDLIDIKNEASEEFLEKVGDCSSFAHAERFGLALDAEWAFYGMQRVGVTGNVSEVTRLSTRAQQARFRRSIWRRSRTWSIHLPWPALKNGSRTQNLFTAMTLLIFFTGNRG
jgi:hypothetical protein